MASSSELFLVLLAAGAAGLVIGLEREQAAARPGSGSFLGGARTFPLVALLGAISLLLAGPLGVVAWLVPLVAVVTFLVIAYVADVRAGNDRGITTEVAFLLAFVLGSLMASAEVIESPTERAMLVLGLAVVVTVLLSVKPSLHSLARRASPEDVIATLKFLVVAVVVLPLLPDVVMGPLDVLNPRKLGFLVMLITGLSFAGYVAIRALGTRRGLALTGVVGGLVSSTAVTLTFSGRAREQPSLRASCALAVCLASSIMFGRVLVMVAIVNHELVPALALPLGAMLVVGMLASWIFYRRSAAGPGVDSELELSNPVELSSAVKFGLFFAVVLVASKAATTYFGTGAIYLTGVLAGTTDVDAITLSMANLAGSGTIGAEVAVTTILLGVGANTVVKAGLALALGGAAFGGRIAVAFGAALAAGALGLLSVWL
jgi:uncharacterized membrane protein (DUF4010 family)